MTFSLVLGSAGGRSNFVVNTIGPEIGGLSAFTASRNRSSMRPFLETISRTTSLPCRRLSVESDHPATHQDCIPNVRRDRVKHGVAVGGIHGSVEFCLQHHRMAASISPVKSGVVVSPCTSILSSTPLKVPIDDKIPAMPLNTERSASLKV